MTGDEIREAFLDYFACKGHLRVTSSSLIPVGDPTLLLTNAGMVQFKPYFTGETAPPNKRLTSSQKSFRTVDIDEVGDTTHLTFFEMLGNFSIGDYFKKEAINLALEFVSSRLDLSKERFVVTTYLDDEESFKLWHQAGIPKERIYKFGDEDNWWGPAGSEGPCGPCSELHYDFGADNGCMTPNCGPNCSQKKASGDICNRFVELWNLVFMQFYQHLDGTRTPLPTPSVDTGMGLERAATIMQGVTSFYETDLFKPLIEKVGRLSHKRYGTDVETDRSMKVVAEHARSSVFLVADGVIPSNDSRGYVLRRVVRRAISHGRRLGIEHSFLGTIAQEVIETMGGAYPELRNHQELILSVLKQEEEGFQQTFQKGYSVLIEALNAFDSGTSKRVSNTKTKTLKGEMAFRLWDTYGFPLQMTQEIAGDHGIEVDLKGFERHMDAQRQRARSSAQFGDDYSKSRVYENLELEATKFLGYQQLTSSSVVAGIISGNQITNEVSGGNDCEIVLMKTPFYPEGGGQVGDSGTISGPNGKIHVHDTQKLMPDLIVHFGKVVQGTVTIGDTIEACVDQTRRADTARNHTATHLLHAALRQILGAHVRQAGSLVSPNRLRFDFTHTEPMSQDEIWKVQELVNERIRQNATVHSEEDSYASAIKKGALAFFGDKYGDKVRLIEIANGEIFSFEVCGGTHVKHTGEVGAVYVIGETNIGAGMRRLEAVSGRESEKMVREQFSREERLLRNLQTTAPNLENRIQKLIDELDELKHEKENATRTLSLESAEKLLDFKQVINGVIILATITPASNVDSLRMIGDWLRDKLGSAVVILGSVINDRPILMAMVTPDLVSTGIDASKIVKEASKIIQGGGGGNPEMAQAGGKRTDKLDDALKLAADLVHKETKPSSNPDS